MNSTFCFLLNHPFKGSETLHHTFQLYIASIDKDIRLKKNVRFLLSDYKGDAEWQQTVRQRAILMETEHQNTRKWQTKAPKIPCSGTTAAAEDPITQGE